MNHLIDILQLSTQEIDELVEKKFEGSLPAFVAAFAKHRTLSAKDIDEMQKMIDSYRAANVPETEEKS